MQTIKNLSIFAFLILFFSFIPLSAEESFDTALQPQEKYEMELAKLQAEKEYLNQLLYQKEEKNKKSPTKKRKTKRKKVSYLSVRIDISQQKMRVSRGNKTLYVWPALTGRGYNPTPRGTFRPKFIRQQYRSEACHREYMPHAIFLKHDLAIYGTKSIYKKTMRLNHNCIRISPRNAKTLYKLVQKYGPYRVIFHITR